MSNYSLDQIVREYLIEIGDTQLNKYAVMLQRGVSGLRELHVDVSALPTVVSLPIDTNTDTVQLPSDYLQYTMIGLCGPDGSVQSLGLNSKMCLPRDHNSCGELVHGVDNSAVAAPIYYGSWDGYADNWRNGEFSGRMFGVGGGINPNGNYRIDHEQWRINLSGIPAGTTHIVLEYVSTLKKVDDSFVVHPFVVEALKAFMWWKTLWHNSNVSLGEKDMAMRDFYNKRRLARKRFNAATTDEVIAAFRGINFAAARF